MTEDEWNPAGVRPVGRQLAGEALEERDERNLPIVDDTFLIILYAADEGTAAFDDGIAALTADTALVDNAGAWTALLRRGATALPAANQYLYLVNGAAGTVGTYTTGIFRITIYGY
jgi:hypothetical protein